MNKFLIFLIFFLWVMDSQAQQDPSKPIKIALLGTAHFMPSSSDMYANESLDVMSEKRQQEIGDLIEKIAAFGPRKICVEYPAIKQKSLDSLFQSYLDGNYKLEKDEIDQVAFKAGKRLGLKQLTAVNYFGRFDSDTVISYALNHGQSEIVSEMGGFGEQFMKEINTQLSEQSIIDFLVYLNSPKILNRNAHFYTKYFMSLGKGEDYVGTELVADWYTTNLHIYTHIIRQVSPEDEIVLVVFGQGHIPILQHLFETNSDYELIKVEDILKE